MNSIERERALTGDISLTNRPMIPPANATPLIKGGRGDRSRKPQRVRPAHTCRGEFRYGLWSVIMGAALGLGIITVPRFWAMIPIQPATAQSDSNNANTPSRRLTINLTISDPADLKVSEGQQVTKGQVLSDRIKERDRLTRQKKLVLNAIATVGKTVIVRPPEPNPVPEAQPLPPMTLAKEEAEIESAELQVQQARRAYNLALQSDPFLQPTAAVETARHEWEATQRSVAQSQQILSAIAQVPGMDQVEISHRQHQVDEAIREANRKEAIYHQKEGELNNAEHARAESLQRLQDAIAQAESRLQLAQAAYAAAKDKQAQLAYDHTIMQARRVEESNRAKQEKAAQEAGYQNRLLGKEKQLFEYQQRLDAIDEQLTELAQVRSPYNGTIQRIKTQRQDNNTLSVTLTLLPTTDSAGSGSGVDSGNPFSDL